MFDYERRLHSSKEFTCSMLFERVLDCDSHQIVKIIPNPGKSGNVSGEFMEAVKQEAEAYQEGDKTKIYSQYFTGDIGVIFSIDIVDKHFMDEYQNYDIGVTAR